MNAAQITERLNLVKESLAEFQEQLDIFDRVWEEYPNQETLEAYLPNLEDGAYELDSFFSAFNALVSDLKLVCYEGLEPFVPFPESARHLWSTMDICREIYCMRNDYPQGTPGNKVSGFMDDLEDPLLPLFEAVSDGARLHSDLMLKKLDMPTFELVWRHHVIEPVIGVLRNVTDSNVQDCLEYIATALPAEQERSNQAVLAAG